MTEVNNEHEMRAFGQRLGRLLRGGEFIELIGDVGSGKTTLVKGIARGMDVNETVQSPSFTISRVYDGRDDLKLTHYDFYRLDHAGIMMNELTDTMHDEKGVVIVEWSDTIKDILPDDRLRITIQARGESSRSLELAAGGEKSRKLLENMA